MFEQLVTINCLRREHTDCPFFMTDAIRFEKVIDNRTKFFPVQQLVRNRRW